MTRGTVQKSVCVLSTLPLYGHIQVKVALITQAYFEEGDFSKVSLLKETFYHLNSCMSKDSQIPPQVFGGNLHFPYLLIINFINIFRHFFSKKCKEFKGIQRNLKELRKI